MGGQICVHRLVWMLNPKGRMRYKAYEKLWEKAAMATWYVICFTP